MNPAKADARPGSDVAPAFWKRVVLSALAWYLALASVGSLLLAFGVTAQWGLGYGAMVLGVLMIIAAEMVRSGIRHA